MMADTPSTRPLLDKLGIKPHHTVIMLDMDDDAFAELVRGRASRVLAAPARDADVIFLRCEDAADLARIPELKADLAKDGALWIVRPKGKGAKGPTEAETMQAGLDAGLVDVKVVSFSPTHTAEKFVYRLRDR
jgi:hypothetical protein